MHCITALVELGVPCAIGRLAYFNMLDPSIRPLQGPPSVASARHPAGAAAAARHCLWLGPWQ